MGYESQCFGEQMPVMYFRGNDLLNAARFKIAKENTVLLFGHCLIVGAPTAQYKKHQFTLQVWSLWGV